MIIRDMQSIDLRFPTSRTLDGSDAVHVDPDYSAAYVILTTDAGVEGHGLTFTIGRGNEICTAAIGAFRHLVVGRSLDGITNDFAGFWRSLASDSQLRWLGPEKGVIHLALAAVVNAVWDLYAKTQGKPLWKLLVDMPAEQLVSCIDFRYLSDALSPGEAVDMLRAKQSEKPAREAELRAVGFPAYTTSVGWLGYSNDKVRELCRDAVVEGFQHFKMKVGGDPADDARRAALIREAIGPKRKLMIDYNQKCDVPEAIERINALSPYDIWWAEEPTSPDDVLGHAAIRNAIRPVGVATGEHCANRVIFKQLLQAGAIDFCQIDSCRLGGVNENLAVILLAAKFGVPVCPHAGGVGLCEYVQHLSMWDYVAVTGSMDNRVIEYVDHLHGHFEDPVVVRQGRYQVPARPGYSITIRPSSREMYRFPEGEAWRS
jgi:L-fuconate dehydratase